MKSFLGIIFLTHLLSCANIANQTEGGTVIGQIFLSESLEYEGGDIILLLSEDSGFNNIKFVNQWKITDAELLFYIPGVINGTYYAIAFEDANGNGTLDLNLPFSDTDYSENFGIYDNNFSYSLIDGSEAVPIRVNNNVQDNIQILIDSSY